MAQIIQATAIARITCKYRLYGGSKFKRYLHVSPSSVTLPQGLKSDSSQLNQPNPSLLIHIQSWHQDGHYREQTALLTAAIEKLRFNPRKNSLFSHSRKRTFSKAAADTFRVYEFDVSFFLSSCKRASEIKPHSYLNLFFFHIAACNNEFVSVFFLYSSGFSSTRQLELQLCQENSIAKH